MANSIKRTLSTTVAAGLAFSAYSGLTTASAMADDTSNYPDEQIRLVIPYSPGGATDIIFRLVATELEDELGVAVVPVNMSGASATIGSREVRNADPDGYTILGSHDVIAAAYLSGVVDYSFDAFEPI
jgi:tripartite-type tricarboxylate transporter receptor subunit TctC